MATVAVTPQDLDAGAPTLGAPAIVVLPEPWPFRPLAEVSERLAWLTDLLSGRTGEQRIKLRDAPRQRLSYRFAFLPPQLSRARLLAERRDVEPIMVPVWPERTALGAPLAANATQLDFDTTTADYRAGGAILVWDSDESCRPALIASVSDTGVTLAAELGAAFAAPTVAPLRFALIGEDGLRIGSKRGVTATAEIDFAATDPLALTGAHTYPSYLGVEVLTDVPARRSELSDSIVRAADPVDSGLGPIVREPLRTQADTIQMLGFVEEGKAAIWRRRLWLHRRAGRLKPFWLPSFRNDLRLASAIGSADTVIGVDSVGPASDYPGRHLMIELKNGTRFFRAVTSAVAGGAGVDALTISSALGQAVAVTDIRLISFLRLCRLDADTVSIAWRHTDIATVMIPAVEVPA